MLVNGTPNNDTLVGTDDDDVINGEGGSDVIDGVLGADQLYGGSGDDTFRFSGVKVTSPAPSVKGVIDGGEGFDVIDLSGLSPTGLGSSNGNLTVTVGNQGFTVSNVERISLGLGDDFVSLPLRTDSILEIRGGNGSDDLTVYGNYAVFGEAGNDRFFIRPSISSGVTSGSINGGAGTDTLRTNIGFIVDLQEGTAKAFQSSYDVTGIEDIELSAYYGQAAAYGNDGANRLTVWSESFSGGSGVLLDGRGGADIISGTKDGDRLYGGAGADTLNGLAGNDSLFGGEDDDILVGGAGNDLLDGGAGYERLSYQGLFESFVATFNEGATIIRSASDGMDSLRGIERIDFLDGSLIIDADAIGSQIIRLYDTVLRRAPDNNGLDFWLDRMEDRGMTLLTVADELSGSAEFQQATGGLTNAQFVDYVYQQALNRAPDAGGKTYWTERLDAGLSRGAFVVDLSESAEHRGLTAGLVAQGYFNTDDTYQAIALLYDGFVGRLPDVGGLIFYAERVKSGQMTIEQVTADFAGSAEFAAAIAGKNNGQIVDYLYQNTLDRLPDSGGRAFYVDQLDRGGSAAGVLQDLALSAEHYNLFAGYITYGIDVI